MRLRSRGSEGRGVFVFGTKGDGRGGDDRGSSSVI